jgi:hypothetical protein
LQSQFIYTFFYNYSWIWEEKGDTDMDIEARQFPIEQTMQLMNQLFVISWYMTVPSVEYTDRREFEQLRRKSGMVSRRLIQQLRQKKLDVSVMRAPGVSENGSYFPPNIVISMHVFVGDTGDIRQVEDILKGIGFTYKPMPAFEFEMTRSGKMKSAKVPFDYVTFDLTDGFVDVRDSELKDLKDFIFKSAKKFGGTVVHWLNKYKSGLNRVTVELNEGDGEPYKNYLTRMWPSKPSAVKIVVASERVERIASSMVSSEDIAERVAVSLVAEVGTIDPKHLKAMSELTDRNAHTDALIYLYDKVLKNKRAVKALEAIKELANYFGSMPAELGKLRTEEFYKPAFVEVKRQFSESVADKINKCF